MGVFNSELSKSRKYLKGKKKMKMSINPLTSRKVDSKRRLVFDEQTMSYVPLTKGEKLIRDPLNPTKLSIGQKLLFDPFTGKVSGCRV